MTQTIAQKCKAVGISLPTYYQRLAKGMTPEQALSTPPMRKRTKYHNLPKAAPQEVECEPLPPATFKYGSQTCHVFEADFQARHKRLAKQKAQEKAKNQSGGRNSPSKKVNKPAPVASPAKRPLYGPVKLDIDDAAISRNFDRACGGYTTVILNHVKDGEFKYQIIGTNGKSKQCTNDVVKFINAIIKICDPEGKTPFRVIER